jgi:hypothetical protein
VAIAWCWLIAFDTTLVWSNLNYPIALAPALLLACGFFTLTLAYCASNTRR